MRPYVLPKGKVMCLLVLLAIRGSGALNGPDWFCPEHRTGLCFIEVWETRSGLGGALFTATTGNAGDQSQGTLQSAFR